MSPPSKKSLLSSDVASAYKVVEDDLYGIAREHLEEQFPHKLEGGKHTTKMLAKMQEVSYLNKTHYVSKEERAQRLQPITDFHKDQEGFTYDRIVGADIEKMNQTVRVEVRDSLGYPRDVH